MKHLDDFLKRNRELCEASTPGPWELTKYTILAETHGKLGIVGWTANNKKTRTAMAANNAALMAASRTSLPLALEMLELCRDALEEAQEALLTCHANMATYYEVSCLPTEDEVMQSYNAQKSAREALAAIEEKAKGNER